MLLTTQRSLSLLNKLNWFFSLYCAIFLNSSYGLWFCSREKLGGQYIIFVLLEFQVLVDIELNLLFPTSTKWNQPTVIDLSANFDLVTSHVQIHIKCSICTIFNHHFWHFLVEFASLYWTRHIAAVICISEAHSDDIEKLICM